MSAFGVGAGDREVDRLSRIERAADGEDGALGERRAVQDEKNPNAAMRWRITDTSLSSSAPAENRRGSILPCEDFVRVKSSRASRSVRSSTIVTPHHPMPAVSEEPEEPADELTIFRFHRIGARSEKRDRIAIDEHPHAARRRALRAAPRSTSDERFRPRRAFTIACQRCRFRILRIGQGAGPSSDAAPAAIAGPAPRAAASVARRGPRRAAGPRPGTRRAAGSRTADSPARAGTRAPGARSRSGRGGRRT